MRRSFAVMLTTALLATGGILLPPAAAAEDGLTPDIHVPLPSMWASQSLTAATGKSLVRTVYVNSHQQDEEYSIDNGATWRPLPAELAGSGSLAGNGGEFIKLLRTVISPGGEGCETSKLNGFTVWNPNTGVQRKVELSAADASVEVECLWLTDAVRGLVLTSDGRVFDISGATAVQRKIKPGPGVPDGALPVGISADGTTVALRASVYDPKGVRSERTYLAVAPISGAAGSAPIEIAGLTDVVVSGQNVHYLIRTAAKLTVCRAPIATPAKAKCVSLRKGDQDYEAQLEVSQGLEQVTWRSTLWLVSGAQVKALKTSGKVTELRGTGFRDPVRPLVRGLDPQRGDVYGQVSPKLGVSWSIPSRKVPTRISALALSTNRVTAVDSRPHAAEAGPAPLWYRDLQGTSVGPERRLPGSAELTEELFTSAGRTVLDCCLSVKARFYDQGRLILKQKLPFNVDEISGPYIDGGDRVRRMDGATFMTGADGDSAVFGSLVAWLDRTDTVTIRDLAAPGTADIVVHLPKQAYEYNFGRLQLWGDWVGISWGDANQGQPESSLVTNFRTGETHTTVGELQDLGDGYALLHRFGALAEGEYELPYTVVTWSFGSDEIRAVPVPQGNQVAIDGIGRVAWAADTAIEIAKVPGAGTSAPRLLGVLAKASVKAGKKWTPQVDMSKALKAGVLEIRDRSGRVVRTISTKATATGSLRTLSWDGRNSAKKKVPAGTYTWTLRADATDGTGTLTDVTGTAAASGEVKVIR